MEEHSTLYGNRLAGWPSEMFGSNTPVKIPEIDTWGGSILRLICDLGATLMENVQAGRITNHQGTKVKRKYWTGSQESSVEFLAYFAFLSASFAL
jgi:hypothetical protein